MPNHRERNLAQRKLVLYKIPHHQIFVFLERFSFCLLFIFCYMVTPSVASPPTQLCMESHNLFTRFTSLKYYEILK